MIPYVILGAISLECVRLIRKRDMLIKEIMSLTLWVSVIISSILAIVGLILFDATTIKDAVTLGIAAPTMIQTLASEKALAAEVTSGFRRSAGRSLDLWIALRRRW
jgi:uncharacterized membrane protein